MFFANPFGRDWGRDGHGVRQAPHPARQHRTFGQFFGRQPRRSSIPSHRGFVDEDEHRRHLERNARRRHPQEQWAQEPQHRGRSMAPGFEIFARESRHPRREQSLHPGFGREPSRPRREPSLHPGFGNESLHPGFARRSHHPHREPSLHPAFHRMSNTPRREPSFRADFRPESAHPHARQHGGPFRRAQSEAAFNRPHRRVRFDDAPQVRRFQRFEARNFGDGDHSLGEEAGRQQGRHGLQRRRSFAQSDFGFDRQQDRRAQPQHQHRRMTDNLEAFLRGFQPHRHHGERFQADRHLQTPDRHSLNPFKLHRGRSQHGNAPNATPQTHGIMRNYVHVKSLAKGGMSTAINVVKSRSTGEVFVQKCVPIGEARWQAKRFRAEVAALVRIKKYGGSPHLNKIIDFEVSSPSSDAVLILEYCDMGSLLDYTRAASQSRTPISEAMVWNVLQAGGKALAFLHEGIIGDRQASNWDPIAHLDIKPQNIFLSSEGGRNAYPRVVFADFGCAVKASDIVRGRENPTVQDVGTSEWYPPEGIGQTPFQYYGPMTDIWQLGATAHTVCCFLIKPDRNALACGVPCGRKYSAELNRSVSHLTAFHSTSRPSPRAIVLTADRAFTTAFWRE